MTIRAATYSWIAVCLLGCGPSSVGVHNDDAGAAADAPAIPSTGPIPEDLAPAAVAQAICNKVAQCGCNWATSAPCKNDGACSPSMCIDVYTRLYKDADMAAAGTGRVYDPQGARKCTDAVAAAACVNDDYVNLCTVLWNGTRAIGESCGETQACQTSDAAPALCGANGVCVARTAGAAAKGVTMGGACSGSCLGIACTILLGAAGGQCQHSDGLTCLAGTCQALRKQGDACITDQYACTDPLTCRGGVCATSLANGSACTLAPNDNPCDAGSGCVAGVCTTLKANGQPCQSSYECLENNCFAGQCIPHFAQPICGG